MSHPIDSVVTDGTRVPKPDFRQYVGSRTALVVNTAASIQSMSLGARGTTTVSLNGISYFYDVLDATTPHDGVNVLVSADGRRYKVPLALPLMQGAQNVVIRKRFDPIYSGNGFKRVVCGDAAYVIQVSYENSVGPHVRLHLETSPDTWEDDPTYTLTVNPLPEQPEIAYIGTTVLMFVPSLMAADGSYDGTLKYFWWKPGFTQFVEHPQSIAGDIPVWGAVSVRWRYDGSSHRFGICNLVSSTVNRLNPSELYPNCYAQRMASYLWNSGTEELDFEDNCDGTWGIAACDFLKTSKLGVSNELLFFEGSYFHDYGIDYTDEVTHPDWRDYVKFYNPPARITGYGSGGFNFANARTWTLDDPSAPTADRHRLAAGAGACHLWEDDDGVTAFATGQRRNDGSSAITHFLAEMCFYDVKADLTTSVLDTIQTGNSYNMAEADILGYKVLAIANANSGGTPTTWFDLGWIDIIIWDKRLRRKRHICKIAAPGASGIDLWVESGRVMLGWSSACTPIRSGAPTRTELTASSYIAEIMAFAFKGNDGANGTNGTNGSNGASGAPVWNFEASTTMGAPATGGFRLNSGTLSIVDAIAVNAQSGDSGNPNLRNYVNTWDDSSNAVRGTITLRNISSPGAFAVFNITGNVTDNTSWQQISLTHVASSGVFAAGNAVAIDFNRAGDVGATGAPGASTAAGVSFSATGNVVATNVQAAIAEVDAEKLALSGGTLTGTLYGTSVSLTGNMAASGDVTGLSVSSSVTGTAEQYAMIARRSGVARGYLAFTNADMCQIYLYNAAGTFLSNPIKAYGDGSVKVDGPMVLRHYAKASLPAAGTYPYGMIYVTDEAGGAIPAFSDGSSWRRVSDRAVVS